MTSPASPPRTLDLTTLSSSEGAPSRHELARYVAGELTVQRRGEIEVLLVHDVAMRAVVDEMRAEIEAFRVSMPFARFEADHARRKEATGGFAQRVKSALASFTSSGARAPALSLAAAACVALLVVGLPSGDLPSGNGDSLEDGLRLKGGAHIGLFVQDATGAHLATDGEELREGDRVQFVVRHAARATARVIVGVDGKGAVTVYDARDLPAVSDAATTEKGAERARVVEESVILDDATGDERFFVVFAEGKASALAQTVLRAARALVDEKVDLAETTQLPLDTRPIEGGGFVQSSVHIVKVAGPRAQVEHAP